MSFVKLNWSPKPKELRQFGAVFMGGLVLIGLVKMFWPFDAIFTRSFTSGEWFIGVGVVVGSIGLTGTRAAMPFYWVWLGVAYVLGNIMSRVIVALLYFLVFTPIGLIGKLIGRDPLQLRRKETATYWRDINLPEKIERYERQF